MPTPGHAPRVRPAPASCSVAPLPARATGGARQLPAHQGLHDEAKVDQAGDDNQAHQPGEPGERLLGPGPAPEPKTQAGREHHHPHSDGSPENDGRPCVTDELRAKSDPRARKAPDRNEQREHASNHKKKVA